MLAVCAVRSGLSREEAVLIGAALVDKPGAVQSPFSKRNFIHLMAHIVCVTEGRSGLLYSSFELVRRLERAGHQVTYVTREDASGAVEAQGFDYYSLATSSTPSPPGGNGQRPRLIQLLVRFWNMSVRRQRAATALGGKAFSDALRTLTPDLLLIDIEQHAYILTAIPQGIPTVLLSPFFSLWKRPGVPPLHKHILPGTGWRGHALGIEWVWLWFRVWKAQRRLREWARTGGVDAVSVLRHHAGQTGFPFQKEAALYEWLIPFTYRTLPVLCLNARELEFPHDPHPSLYYVGPMIHRRRRDVHVSPRVEQRLQPVLDRQQKAAPDRRPLVLVVCSTFADTNTGFLQRIMRAARLRPGWDIIVSLGGPGATSVLDGLPRNVYAFPWIPVLDVLPHASAVVTNAGINTINECIRFGVPSVVYSLGTNDQNGTAARVEYHGVSVVGDLDEDRAETMVAYLERALHDVTIQSNIERMQQRFRAYEDERRAVAFIEKMLARAQSQL